MSDKPISFLDRPLARGAAILVGLAAAALLAYIERDRFMPGGPSAEAPGPGTAAFEACFEQETATINKMLEEGLIDEGRAALFTSRAEARCRTQNPAP